MDLTGLALTGLVLAVVGFLLGSVNPATLLARALGRDLRTSGSGNPGATNAGRVLGRKWGVLVLVLDVAKAYLPTLLVLRSAGLLLALVVASGVVLGHVFSPFLRGRGGKGVACAIGAVLAVAPLVAVVSLAVFGLTFAAVRYVGEASVAATAAVLVVGVLGVVGVGPGTPVTLGVWLVAVSALVLGRHRRNVVLWWLRVRRRRTT